MYAFELVSNHSRWYTNDSEYAMVHEAAGANSEAGSATGTMTAPRAANCRIAACIASAICGSRSSMKNPWGTPMRTPVTSLPRSAVKSGTRRCADVASKWSLPAMAPSINATSATVRPIGPMLSWLQLSEMQPCRLTRP